MTKCSKELLNLLHFVGFMMSDNYKKFQTSTLNGYREKVDFNKKLDRNSEIKKGHNFDKLQSRVMELASSCCFYNVRQL